MLWTFAQALQRADDMVTGFTTALTTNFHHNFHHNLHHREVQHVNVRQADEQNASVGVAPVRFTRRGLRSQITLGEEII